jgi:hypothetical protein
MKSMLFIGVPQNWRKHQIIRVPSAVRTKQSTSALRLCGSDGSAVGLHVTSPRRAPQQGGRLRIIVMG